MFVKRNSDGRIVAASEAPEPGFTEHVADDDNELIAFTRRVRASSQELDDQIRQLRSSDADLARVVEDIINLLTDKGIIQFTELPEAAQKKLLQRKLLRRDIRRLDLLADDDTDDLVP